MKTAGKDIIIWSIFLGVGFTIGFVISEFNQRNRELTDHAEQMLQDIPFFTDYLEEVP